MKLLHALLALSLSCLLLPGTAIAEFDEGLTAYNKKDYATALREWKPLAAQGNASAQSNLGVMYENGQGVAQDYKEAVRLYRLAAAQGNANGQSNLGVMYQNGQVVAQDYKEAVKWFRLAADQGDADAQRNLGAMYDSGEGVPKDDKESEAYRNTKIRNLPLIRKIGAKICQNGRVQMGHEQIKVVSVGYVEGITDDKVKIRVSRTYFKSNPSLSPSGFSPSIIWDDPMNWYLCR
jgi:hypothetical protein